MSHPYQHAVSSAHRWGGTPEDYLPLHDWFDASKAHVADFRHRALRHHSEGIFAAEREFGATITNSDGRKVPTRLLGEQHVREDLGCIPTLADWLLKIRAEPWMGHAAKLEIAHETPANVPIKRVHETRRVKIAQIPMEAQ